MLFHVTMSDTNKEVQIMSTITLKNNAAYRESRMTLKERIEDYFAENLNAVALGLYAAAGKMSDVQILRDMMTR